MKPSFYRRIRHRPVSKDIAAPKKDTVQDQQFFGETLHEPFFKPIVSAQQGVHRKCADCEKEEQVQRSPVKKEDEKVMKREEKKDEKVQRMAGKKEEEKKVQKKEGKQEEEKVMKSAEKKEEDKIHKKEGTPSAVGAAGTASNYIGSINGKGQRMDAGIQSFYEHRIGADFSDVKIHTGKEAADSAKDIHAQAYAYGNHIVFNEGKYQPETSEGKHLLAHELAHVVQQNAALKEPTGIFRTANFVAGTPVYDINLADQYVKNVNGIADNRFGSTHPLINAHDLTTTGVNPIKKPVESDLSATAVGNQFEASVTTIPANETSFYMQLPQKGLKKWTKNVPIANLPNHFQHLACRISNTNVEVTGDPSNSAVITNTHTHEGIHAQHIRALHNEYIVKFDQFLGSAKAKGATEADSKKLLLAQIAGRANAAHSLFSKEFTQRADAFHKDPSGKNGIMTLRNISTDCKKVEVTTTS